MSAVTDARPAARWQFDAIGTTWQIDTSEPLDAAVRGDVEALVATFDREWSRFRPDSLVTALSQGAGSVPAPPDTADMFEAFVAVSDATAGAVNPLIGASLDARGYGALYGFVDRGPHPAPDDWRTRLDWSHERISLSEPGIIDVGALGKGRLVDRVLAVITHTHKGDVVVDASGDLAVQGAPQRVALEHPYDPRRAIGVVEVRDAALCASATNRRSWGDGLHHVLDARTGEPVRTIAATWALAPTAMRADAIATALFFDGGPELASAWGVTWVRMTTDGRVEWSPGSTAELFV